MWAFPIWVLFGFGVIDAPLYADGARPPHLEQGASHSPPAIESLVKATAYKKVLRDREILTSADLDDEAGLYHFYSAMLVRAGLPKTRRILTDYTLYSRLVPYVDRTTYSPITRILDLEGGIWKFKLHSQVRFDEVAERWIRYEIVGGHFRGLRGDIFFESAGEKGTLVYFGGEQRGRHWPPSIVIERGAEIVFGFTAGRMRKYVESDPASEKQPESPEKPERQKDPPQGLANDGQKLPEPRSRL